MDELNMKDLEQIPIPDGLEERLSAKIDEWEAQEQLAQEPRRERRKLVSMWRVASVAACVAIVLGLGWVLWNQNDAEEQQLASATEDTYTDPAEARRETEKALELLAANLDKGMSQMEKAKGLTDATEEKLNRQLNLQF